MNCLVIVSPFIVYMALFQQHLIVEQFLFKNIFLVFFYGWLFAICYFYLKCFDYYSNLYGSKYKFVVLFKARMIHRKHFLPVLCAASKSFDDEPGLVALTPSALTLTENRAPDF